MIRYLSISLFKIQDFSLHYLLTGGGLVLSSPGVVFGSGTLVGIGGGGVVGGGGGTVEGSGGGSSLGSGRCRFPRCCGRDRSGLS